MSITDAWLGERVQRLVDTFTVIGRTRMAGVPLLNAALRVEAVGFAMQADETDAAGDASAAGALGALGVLVTPWFMNLIWLVPEGQPLAPGATRLRRLGGEPLEFIGAHDAEAGCYELCSLFSPMFEFNDQASACATAMAVLDALRMPRPRAAGAPAANARRSFLFGRRAADAAA